MIPGGVLDGEVCDGDRVDKATDDHEGGVFVAVFPTDDGGLRYAVDGYGALQFLTEEKLVVHPG
jgi:hypothetical protein